MKTKQTSLAFLALGAPPPPSCFIYLVTLHTPSPCGGVNGGPPGVQTSLSGEGVIMMQHGKRLTMRKWCSETRQDKSAQAQWLVKYLKIWLGLN